MNASDHKCPVSKDVPVVFLVGIMLRCGVSGGMGNSCGACGAVWQGDSQLVPPVSGQETYDRGLQLSAMVDSQLGGGAKK